jgi:hypothetical protein
MDSLEGLFLRPRQVRYQAALGPDSESAGRARPAWFAGV